MRIPKDMGRHHVGAYAAQAAYFFMLSLIPIILLLLTIGKIYAGYESRCNDSQ